ncbi:cold-shock protein [Micrococcus sp.]|uniref:cold-shock protein n=1 Tax=Micrococcus sp. TaxID=1271 RepID=UPI002A90C1DE|nr:cold shock domain-containing protein [Micrococcus sp.]MDY6056061.1 cold shock domain-containing protein [Micrococcus sp.]
MRADGHVVSWNEEEGWGVLSSEATPGGCWAHFSALEGDGFRQAQPGERVRFTFAATGPQGQDGFSYRAERVEFPDRARTD